MRNNKKNMTQHVCILVSFAPSLLNFRGPLIRKMLALGIKVTALAPDFDKEVRTTLTAWGATCQDIALSRRGLNPIADLATMRQLRSILKDLQPDLLLTYTIKPNIWGAFAAASAGVRSVGSVTGLGYMFSKDASAGLNTRLVQWVGRTLYARAIRHNWRVVFQNTDDLEDFIAAGCLADKGKARLVNGSGVDMEHYAVAPLPDQPVFLMISRLLGEKGVREYAEAALIVKERLPTAEFHLVGFMDDGMDAISQGELDRWIAGGLKYLGPKADVRPCLTDSNIYVLPSYREGTPRSVLEAMAMGRAIITTDAPGCRETVRNAATGFLVPVRDIETLADRMEQLATDKPLRDQMGAASLKYARAKYEVNKVNDHLLDHLELRT
jgi:glycosyltransferase involved in cell wall biosynthesis